MGDFFELKSGQRSNVYFNMRLLTSYPSETQEIVEKMCRDIALEGGAYICGCGGFGNVLATLVAIQKKMPLLILREVPKTHGENRDIIGLKEDIQKCILIDDVFTTGTTIREVKTRLFNYNITVESVHVILNRSQPYLGTLDGLRVSSLFNLFHFRNVLSYREWVEVCIEKNQSRICISYDKYCNVADVVKMIEIYSSKSRLCAVKLHPEFVRDIGMQYEALKECAIRHSCILIADMKYSDIGYVVRMQYECSTFHVNQWADLVTAYAREGIVEAFDHGLVGVLLIASMSSGYSDEEEAIRVAQKYSHIVCGFITQTKLLKPNDMRFLHFTPGVRLEEGVDKDQCYHSPSYLLENAMTDIFIVGRGIQNENDLEKFNALIRP